MYFSFHNQTTWYYIATLLNTFHQQHKLRQKSHLFHRNISEYWVTVMHFIKNVSNSIFSRRLYISKFFSMSPRKFWVSILKDKHPVLNLTDSNFSSCNAVHPKNLIMCRKMKVVKYLQISHCAYFPGPSHIPAQSIHFSQHPVLKCTKQFSPIKQKPKQRSSRQLHSFWFTNSQFLIPR